MTTSATLERALPATLPLPRYHQIYLVLRDQLLAGRFAANLPMPGELELAGQFGVSRVTIRSALDRLVTENLIERFRGRGTFPRAPAKSMATGARPKMSGLFDNLVALGLKTTARVLEFVLIKAPSDVAEALRIAPAGTVQHAIRVRSYNGGPVSHITTYVPEHLARGFGRRELAAKPMLTLLEASGVKVASADQSMSARLADANVAQWLEVDLGAPLIAVSRLVYDKAGQPVQLLRGLYRPDRYEYRMHLSRTGHDEGRIWITDKTIDGP